MQTHELILNMKIKRNAHILSELSHLFESEADTRVVNGISGN